MSNKPSRNDGYSEFDHNWTALSTLRHRMLISFFIFFLFIERIFLQTILSSDFTSDTSLNSTGNPYQTTVTVNVNAGVVLTIGEGVIIEFCGGCNLNVVGQLIVNATESERVTFQGVGWGSIILENGYESTEFTLKHSDFAGGSDCYLNFNVPTNINNVLIDDVRFTDSSTNDEHAIFLNFPEAGTKTVEIKNCVFSGLRNRYIISFTHIDDGLVDNCLFENIIHEFGFMVDADGSTNTGFHTVSNCQFLHNDFRHFGSRTYSGAEFFNNTYLHNRGYWGIHSYDFTFSFHDNLMRNNTCVEDLIRAEAPITSIYDNILEDNIGTILYTMNPGLTNVTGNTIVNNDGDGGSIIYVNDDQNILDFTFNDVRDNTGSSYVIHLNGVLEESKIYRNILNNPDIAIEIRTGQTGDDSIECRNNYWGTTDRGVIDDRIEDYVDNVLYKRVYYEPILENDDIYNCDPYPPCNVTLGECKFNETGFSYCYCYDFSISNCTYFPPLICHEVRADDLENVCNGHGTCVSEDYCLCDDDYYGDDCDTLSYYHLMALESGSSCEVVSGVFRPGRRSRGYGCSFLDYQVYLFGGYGLDEDGNVGYYNDVWKLSDDMEGWCFIEGSQYANDTVIPYDGEIGVFSGGYDVISGTASFYGFAALFSFFVFGGDRAEMNQTNELWEFQIVPNRHQWRMLQAHDDSPVGSPDPRSRGCVAKKDNSIVYMFGGISQNNLGDKLFKNDLWEYDVSMNSFTLIKEGNETLGDTNITFHELEPNICDENSPLIYPRFDSLCWIDDGSDKFIVFGGTLDSLQSSNDLWNFNLSNNCWVYVRGGNERLSTVVVDENQYNVGNEPSVRSGSIGFLNQNTNSFYEFFADSREFWFFGGFDYITGNTFRDLWMFSSALSEFKLMNNGTVDSLVPNKRNFEDYEIGTRGYGMGIFCRDKSILIFGGEYAL